MLTFRAQNESEARKWKNEVKKLQNAIELLKKAGANTKKCDTTSTNNNENLPQAAMGGLVNYEIQRLTNEINALKEANKALEEKKVVSLSFNKYFEKACCVVVFKHVKLKVKFCKNFSLTFLQCFRLCLKLSISW